MAGSVRPADDLFHDLVGAAVNALRTRIDEGAADCVFAHVAIVIVGNSIRLVSAVELGDALG